MEIAVAKSIFALVVKLRPECAHIVVFETHGIGQTPSSPVYRCTAPVSPYSILATLLVSICTLPSIRQHLSSDDCLGITVKIIGTVLYCIAYHSCIQSKHIYISSFHR